MFMSPRSSVPSVFDSGIQVTFICVDGFSRKSLRKRRYESLKYGHVSWRKLSSSDVSTTCASSRSHFIRYRNRRRTCELTVDLVLQPVVRSYAKSHVWGSVRESIGDL